MERALLVLRISAVVAAAAACELTAVAWVIEADPWGMISRFLPPDSGFDAAAVMLRHACNGITAVSALLLSTAVLAGGQMTRLPLVVRGSMSVRRNEPAVN